VPAKSIRHRAAATAATTTSALRREPAKQRRHGFSISSNGAITRASENYGISAIQYDQRMAKYRDQQH